ncbi:MAG: 4-demethylwyosine synthase TYW1 [Natrialbaceae archaeon]|nr:4-demethylwyosine synthase TYW1 [Natrialbaceae archaeon]
MPKQVSDPDHYHSQNHTAAQTCGWTANALRGEGKCYKNIFYGIQSHRCIQMTPVVRCNERCVFCWRDHTGHAYELDDVEWDDPEAVVDASIELQQKLLSGFGGNDAVPRSVFEEAMTPRHVAISLDGEPTLYPYLPELIEAFHDRDITTFLVSNGTRPKVLERCDPTQLYVSVDAAERADVRRRRQGPARTTPGSDSIDTLDVLAAKDKTRTVLRTTLVNGENMHDPDWYAALYQRAEPDFVELKAYMHVGHSRDRLDRDRCPTTTMSAPSPRPSRPISPSTPRFKEVPASNVVLLARTADTWVPSFARTATSGVNSQQRHNSCVTHTTSGMLIPDSAQR